MCASVSLCVCVVRASSAYVVVCKCVCVMTSAVTFSAHSLVRNDQVQPASTDEHCSTQTQASLESLACSNSIALLSRESVVYLRGAKSCSSPSDTAADLGRTENCAGVGDSPAPRSCSVSSPAPPATATVASVVDVHGVCVVERATYVDSQPQLPPHYSHQHTVIGKQHSADCLEVESRDCHVSTTSSSQVNDNTGALYRAFSSPAPPPAYSAYRAPVTSVDSSGSELVVGSESEPLSQTSTDTRIQQYVKSLSMHTYGDQQTGMCLQPRMYSHYMYSAGHVGGRGYHQTRATTAATTHATTDAASFVQYQHLSGYGGTSGGGGQCSPSYAAANYGYTTSDHVSPPGATTHATVFSSGHESRVAEMSAGVDYAAFSYPSTQSFYHGSTATPATETIAAGLTDASNAAFCGAGGAQSSVCYGQEAVVGSPLAGAEAAAAAAAVVVEQDTKRLDQHACHVSPLPLGAEPVSDALASADFHSPSSLNSPSSAVTSGTRRRRNSNSVSSSRRRRRADPSPSGELATKIDRIFLWDLDETVIVFHSLLTGQYARENDRNPMLCAQIGASLETLVFALGEDLFFLKELDVESQYPTHVTNIDDLNTEDNNQDLSSYNFPADGLAATLGVHTASGNVYSSLARTNVSSDIARKIAFRHRRVKELYTMYRHNVSELFRSHMHGRHPTFEQNWANVRHELESVTNNWLSKATTCLKLIQERKQCASMLITRNMLMTTFAKAVIFGLSECFEPENIFSAYKVGYESCVNTIRQRYTEQHGREVICIIVGNADHHTASGGLVPVARQFGMPYFPINSDKDLHALQFFLQYGYM